MFAHRNYAPTATPMRMPAQVEAMWRRVYECSTREWVGKLEGYFDEDAQLTANAAVVGWYAKRGGSWVPRSYRPATLPRTGRLVYLGEFMAFWTVDRSGNCIEHVCSPDGSSGRPGLLWSQDLRAALAFPDLPLGDCKLLPSPRERHLVRTWNAGRDARCASPISPPVGTNIGVGVPGLVIEYRSDKFTHGTMKTYIHHFEGDVLVNVSPGRTPRAIMFRGGRLRLTKDGLEG